MKKHWLIAVTAMVLIAACGKNEGPAPGPLMPGAPTIPPIKIEDVRPAVPTSPLPAPSATADPTPGPRPGQANDHSSPEFKAGDAVKK